MTIPTSQPFPSHPPIHFFAGAPVFGFGLDAALTLVFPLFTPPVAGALLGVAAGFFWGCATFGLFTAGAPVTAGFFAAGVAVVGFLAVPAAPPVPVVADFFAGGNPGLLLGDGLYALAPFMP